MSPQLLNLIFIDVNDSEKNENKKHSSSWQMRPRILTSSKLNFSVTLDKHLCHQSCNIGRDKVSVLEWASLKLFYLICFIINLNLRIILFWNKGREKYNFYYLLFCVKRLSSLRQVSLINIPQILASLCIIKKR